MKSYLSLIPISEKQHKKQSKMTRICIILAVLLVTAMFGLAEMEMRSQLRQTIRQDGYWHLSICDLDKEEAARVRELDCVDTVSPYGTLNYRLDQNDTINGKNTIICGLDQNFLDIYEDIKIDGRLAEAENEAVIPENMAKEQGLKTGDTILLSMGDGREKEYMITGITNTMASLMKNDCYGILLNINGFNELAGTENNQVIYYVKFKSQYPLRKSIDEVKEVVTPCGASVGENIKLLGIIGMSRDSYMMQLYATAAVLAMLVITSGVLMISSNINSNIAKRTEFFGMLRCQGATTGQIKKFVTLEALNWCKTAIPEGLVLGVAITCALCNLLRYLSPDYFSDMPVFAVSKIAIVMGAAVGIVTVLLAAISPARKASEVSPLIAVSGNVHTSYRKNSKMHLWILPVEIKLGVHHSYTNKKNFVLMVSSFALSIILFLTFSTGIDFLHHALKPLQVYTPDISVYSEQNLCEIEKNLTTDIKKISGVKNVYGRSFAYDMTGKTGDGADVVLNLLSYENTQFGWAKDKVMEGSLEKVQNGNEAMAVFREDTSVHVGDILTVDTLNGKKEIKIGAVLTDSPFSMEDDEETVICSENTFQELTGENAYTIIDVQLTQKATDETVNQIHDMFPEKMVFSDQRADNSSVRGAYLSMSVFIYGFIAIIAMISVFQIMNSVALSVNARIHEYGTMRAIGAETGQLTRMIMGEAASYGLFGIVTGTIVGIPLHRALYTWIITSRWGDAWILPWGKLLVIVLLILMACLSAVYRPVREIQRMSVTETLTTF